MRSAVFITILSCLAMFSLQAMSDQRRLSLTAKYHEARRLGYKMPTPMCKPLHEAGIFIIDTAAMCALEVINPTFPLIAKAIKVGKKVADKLHVMGMLNGLKHKAEAFIMSKFLGIFGCKVRRRLFDLIKGIKKAANKVKKHVSKAVKKVKKTVKKTVKNVKKTAKKTVNNAKKAATGAVKAVAKKANNVKKTAVKTANNAKKAAAGAVKAVGKEANKVKKTAVKVGKGVAKVAKKVGKVANVAGKFVLKHSAVIKKVLCPVVRKLCDPGCAAAVTSFKAAGLAIAASFHIPSNCIVSAVEEACKRVCHLVCSRRRLAIRRMAAVY